MIDFLLNTFFVVGLTFLIIASVGMTFVFLAGCWQALRGCRHGKR